MTVQFFRKEHLWLLLWAWILLPIIAHADIYKYTDSEGKVHFTNTPTGSQFAFYRKEHASGTEIEEIIRCNARQFQIEEGLVHAVIKAESDFDPRAVSAKGAMGMMQLIPETARDMDVGDPFDPVQNIRGGVRYLRKMMDEFGGNLDLALAAYNAGPAAVHRYGGVPPYEETQNYIQRVKRFLKDFRSR